MFTHLHDQGIPLCVYQLGPSLVPFFSELFPFSVVDAVLELFFLKQDHLYIVLWVFTKQRGCGGRN